MAIIAGYKRTHNANPVMRRKIAIRGNDISKRLRRPKVSMVHTAGNARAKLMAPKPNDDSRACISVKFASVKMDEE